MGFDDTGLGEAMSRASADSEIKALKEQVLALQRQVERLFELYELNRQLAITAFNN